MKIVQLPLQLGHIADLKKSHFKKVLNLLNSFNSEFNYSDKLNNFQ